MKQNKFRYFWTTVRWKTSNIAISDKKSCFDISVDISDKVTLAAKHIFQSRTQENSNNVFFQELYS